MCGVWQVYRSLSVGVPDLVLIALLWMVKCVVVEYDPLITSGFAFNIRFEGLIHGDEGRFIRFRQETSDDGG